MAISAIATFKEHLKNRCKSEEDYDLILTGDLGACGSKIFKRVLKSEGYNLKNIWMLEKVFIKNRLFWSKWTNCSSIIFI